MSELTRAGNRDDGRHDFDFLFGRWVVTNRKLRNPLDPGDEEWLEFPAHVETRPVMGGLGNIDTYLAPEFPGRPRFEALALRLFDPGANVWRVWWASTAAAGQLDTPVVGRFWGERGQFGCDDVLDGRALKVRYEWSEITSASPQWQQCFSFDRGESWQPNWIMRWRREPSNSVERSTCGSPPTDN